MVKKLLNAIQKENVERVKELLERQVKVNGYEDEDKITPLHFAAQRNSAKAFQIANLLLEAGANPLAKNCPDGETPIDIALGGKNLKMAHVLEEREENFH